MQGIKLESKKENFYFNWTAKRGALPAKVVLPLFSTTGKSENLPLVSIGQKVKTGEKVAYPADGSGVWTHASISGEVTAIETFPHPVLGEARAIQITGDGRDLRCDEIGKERADWESFSPEELLEIFRQSGIATGMDRSEALHYKAALSGNPKVVVVNACESEPYIASAHSLIMSHPVEVLKGAEILRRAVAAEKIVIAFENHTQEAAELLKSKIYFLKWDHCEVRMFPSQYPLEMEAVLVKELARIGPFKDAKNYFSADASSVFAVFEAVVLQKPFYERILTIGGECLVEPKQLWVRSGTEFEDLIKHCKGFLREPGRLLMNGPIRGYAQEALNVPVLKETRAVLALPAELTSAPGEESPCIRSGLCIEHCPLEIPPILIVQAMEKGYHHIAEELGLRACIHCGVCTYLCPSKKRLGDNLLQGLREISAAGSEPPAW